MASAREMRLRIKSVRNISQVTRALEAVSAAKVRKAIQALTATRSYATKAWQVLTHITPIANYANFFGAPPDSGLPGGPWQWFYHMILPWATFALLFSALYVGAKNRREEEGLR